MEIRHITWFFNEYHISSFLKRKFGIASSRDSAENSKLHVFTANEIPDLQPLIRFMSL